MGFYEVVNIFGPYIGIAAAWLRIEWIIKLIEKRIEASDEKLDTVADKIDQNRDMRELIMLMRWNFEALTGKKSPPFVDMDR